VTASGQRARKTVLGESRRDERAARNQSLFREVNEPVAELNQTFEQLTPYGGWAC
jgi:hypothetical protein